jgi:hypothetical protein
MSALPMRLLFVSFFSVIAQYFASGQAKNESFCAQTL